jgi:hypothetical protein
VTLPQRDDRDGIWVWFGVLCFMAGILAALYYLYDLGYPNRFVGDMYGMEVLFRLYVLSFAAGPLLLGGVLLVVGRWKGMRRLLILGTAVVIVSSVIMTAMAVGVVRSRHLNDVRKNYPEKSVEELLFIARDQKDQHAIDALMIKADPAAVPGLALILLSETEPGNLRHAAAQALARIGGDDARTALERARDSSRDNHFREFVSEIMGNMGSRR